MSDQTTELVDVSAKDKNTTDKAPVCKINKDGNFAFTNHHELGAAAKMAMSMQLAPPDLKAMGFEAVASALMFCQQFGLKHKAMNKMAYIKGKICPHSSLYTALAQKHPEWGEQRVFYVDKESKEICIKNENLTNEVFACVIQIKTKGRDYWNEYYFTMDDAKKAKLLTTSTKPDSVWSKYTKDMLYHKCKKRAYDAEYASALEGVDMFEDIKEVYETDVTPSRDKKEVGSIIAELD
jgi:hypothetical protein